MSEKKRVLGIVGPTASGKTSVSIELAGKLSGEIVCMDSMQIYRGMDIGTAKPTREEQQSAVHHMIDVADPGQDYSVTEYARAAGKWLDDVPHPILVGGTGFYLRALSLPMDFGFVKGNEEIRRKYQQFADENGLDALHSLLENVDKISADRLHKNDSRRVIRALEVYELTGKPFSQQEMPSYDESAWNFILFALDWPREVLYDRINRRVDEMLQNGLLQEVEALLSQGVSPDAQSMQGLGYKELIPVLKGEENLDTAAENMKQRTRNYAKRQLTWFRHDPRIHWLPVHEGSTAREIAQTILTNPEVQKIV